MNDNNTQSIFDDQNPNTKEQNTDQPDLVPLDPNYKSKIDSYKNQEISAQTQERLNTPLKKSVQPKYKDYLKLILDLINQGTIDVFNPSSIINTNIYNTLNEQGKADVDKILINLINMVQRMQYLNEKGEENSFQLESIVDNIWQTKEKIEQKHGDVLKI